MDNLIELRHRLRSRPLSRLGSIRRATGLSRAAFTAALAEELGWPEVPAAVLAALEAGRPEPTQRVLDAADRVRRSWLYDEESG